MSFGIGADQGVAVGQALTAAANLAEETLITLGAVLPHDLLGHLARDVVGVGVIGLIDVSSIRRIHILAGVASARVDVRVDLDDLRARCQLMQVLGIVEEHHVTGTRKPRCNPLGVVYATELAGTGADAVVVLQQARRFTLLVAHRVAEAIEEITGRAGGLGNAGGRIAHDKGAAVVDHIDLTLY